MGLGLMDNGETVEDYRAASIPERIHVFNNTFVDNPYAITGGDNLIAVNNIFVGASVMALKNVDGSSVVAHSLFANNAVDSSGSNVVSPTILADPLLDTAFKLLPGSPAIDVGTANYVHNGEMVLNYPPGAYAGSAPDLGWHETSATPDPTPTPTDTPVGVPTPTPTPTPIPTAIPTATPTSTQGSDDIVFVGSTGKGVAGGVSFADEDILAYDRNNSEWVKYFDGSDTAGSRVDFDSIARLPDGSLLLSLELDETISPLGLVEDSDIVRFVPSSAGSPTLGIFEWYLDGSDVRLIGDSEDIDGLAVLNDGRLVMSTRGKAAVADAAGNSVYAEDEDLLVFTPSQLGQTTAGSWALYFDGSDVGLGVDDGGDEDVREIWIDPGNGDIYLTTQDAFSVPGPGGDISGSNNDIFVCAPSSIGDTTSCTFRIYWNGAANGFGGEIIDTLDIGKGMLAQSASLADVLHILDDPGVEGADDVHDDEALDDVPEFQEFMPFVNR